LRKAASLILLIVGISCGALLLLLITKLGSVQSADRILLWCAMASIPFLLVRLIFFVLEGFINNALFYPLAPNVYLQAFMQVLMEFICIGLYVTGGLFSLKMDKSQYAGETSELLPSAAQYTGRNQSSTQPPQQYRQQQYSQQQSDYSESGRRV